MEARLDCEFGKESDHEGMKCHIAIYGKQKFPHQFLVLTINDYEL